MNEKELRKQEFLSGSWVRLGDGQRWCISAIPLGANGDVICDALEKIFELQEQQLPENPTAADYVKRSRESLKLNGEFAFALLRVNYPKLPREYFDESNLVTLQHAVLLRNIAQGSTKIGEIIGEAEPGEAERTAE